MTDSLFIGIVKNTQPEIFLVSTDITLMNALRNGTEAEFRASFPELSEAEKDELVREARRHPV